MSARRDVFWLGSAAFATLVAAVAFWSPVLSAGLLALGIVSILGLMRRSHARLAASQERMSADIDAISRRLLQLEERAREGRDGPIGEDAAAGSRMTAGVEAATAEIGLLSGIVRELAAIVSGQDGEIDRIRSALDRLQKPVEPPKSPAKIAALSPADASPQEKPRQPEHDAGTEAREIAPAIPLVDPHAERRILDAFDADGVQIWLQPIVALPQRKILSYEAVARLDAGGTLLDAREFLPILERNGRTTALDRTMLNGLMMVARHLRQRSSPAHVVYGLAPLSLYEPGILRLLTDMVASDRETSERLIIALSQWSWQTLDREQENQLGNLQGQIGFMLDRPVDLRIDLRALSRRGVGFMKVPVPLLIGPKAREASPDIATQDLAAALGRAGIRLIASDVEKESDVPDLIDLDVPLAQGTVFAAPRAVRTDVLAPEPVPGSSDQGPADSAPEPAPPSQKRNFRDFLRRAV